MVFPIPIFLLKLFSYLVVNLLKNGCIEICINILQIYIKKLTLRFWNIFRENGTQKTQKQTYWQKAANKYIIIYIKKQRKMSGFSSRDEYGKFFEKSLSTSYSSSFLFPFQFYQLPSFLKKLVNLLIYKFGFYQKISSPLNSLL